MKVQSVPRMIHCYILRYAANNKHIVLASTHDYIVNDKMIRVPQHFITDLASVPRIFWAVLSPIGKHSIASVLHDYLYSKQCELSIHRKEADDMFYAIMLYNHVNKFTAKLMYYSVRLFGGSSWKKN